MARAQRRLVVTGVVLALLVLAAGGRAVAFYVDYLWFGEVGYPQVFLTALWAGVGTFLAGCAVFLALFVPNALLALALARRLVRRVPVHLVDPPFRGPRGLGIDLGGLGGLGGPGGLRPSESERLRPFGDLAAAFGGPEAGRWVLERLGGQLALATGLACALVMGVAAAGRWEVVLRALNAAPFGVADPLFGLDVAFHVFTLPLLRFVQGWLLWAVLLAAAGVLALYLLALYSVDPTFEHALFHLTNRGRALRTHVLALAALALALAALGIWLGSYDVLLSRHERMVGASFTDVHARLPATQALAVTVAVAALLAAAAIFRRDYALPVAGAVLAGFVLLAGRGVLPALVQKLQVEPAEIDRERPYIAHNIRFTREAFGLRDVVEQTLPAEEEARPEEVRANPETIGNVRLWDHRPLKDTYNQIQSIRPYYTFDDVDIDRYVIDGQYRQVMLSARELAADRLGPQAQTWVNRRLQYTHGYGLAMSPVNVISREGLPALLVQDIPPAGKLRVDRPQVYYGEQTARYAIVNTAVPEFDYPRGDQNEFATYQGAGGVRVGPLWRRLALAWYLADFNLLVSTYVGGESRVLFRRTVADRVQRVAPFLKLDRDPYLVVADGRLVWLVDAYTTSDRYPYAQWVVERAGGAALPAVPGTPGPPAREPRPPGAPGVPGGDQVGFFPRLAYNYVRNSVKASVDAYDGTITLYLADPADPLARTYGAIYPGLFRPLEAMPAALRAHVRYPEDLFRVQAEILRAYHVQDPQVFYNGEDLWSTAQETLGGRRQPVDPYYVIMRLPGEAREEFLLMLPFTPANRDNMIAWLAARSDGAEYGKLLLYKFPKGSLVYGPAQIDARIDQDPTISAQLTLWNQQGSRVIRGNLLVIPIGNSTLYVEPIYLQAERSQLPELKRVIAATGNRLAMEATLEEGLARLFGPDAAEAPPDRPPAPPATAPAAPSAEAARAARETYQRALEALRAGDFTRFGEELRRLEEQLAALERGAAP